MPPLPAVPPLPANVEVAPVILQAPQKSPGLRKLSKSKTRGSPTTSRSGSRRTSEQSRRESSSKTPRLGSISSILRSFQRSMSGDIRKESSDPILANMQHSELALGSSSSLPGDGKPLSKPAPSSPILRQKRFLAGISRKSYDFTFVSAGSSCLPPSTRIIRPTTAPAEQQSFPSDVEGFAALFPTTPGIPGMSSSAASGSYFPNFEKNGAPISFGIEYANPWKATFAPEKTYISQSPVSPGQSNRSLQDIRRGSHSDASVYKQSIIEQNARGSSNGISADSSHSKLLPADRPAPSASSLGLATHQVHPTTPPAPLATPASRFLTSRNQHESLHSAASSVEPWTPSMSSSKPVPSPQVVRFRHSSRKSSKDVDGVTEQEMAPHLYLETLGAISLRNPWTAASNEATLLASAKSSLHKRSKSAGAGAKTERRGSEQKLESRPLEGSIEIAFIRRRSEPKARPVDNPPSRDILVPAKGIKGTTAVRLQPCRHPIFPIEQNMSSFLDCTTSPSIDSAVSPAVSQTDLDDLHCSPMQSFRNPFLTKLSAS